MKWVLFVICEDDLETIILLFISDFWLGIMKLEKHKAFKKRYKQRINACSLASNKIVVLVLTRRSGHFMQENCI